MAKSSERKKMPIDKRRAEVAAQYCQAHPLHVIAERLGMTPALVRRDLAAIRKQWRESALRDFDEAKDAELAKLDEVEREAWEKWEASLAALRRTVLKKRGKQKAGARSALGDVVVEHVETTIEQRGNAQLLKIVYHCIEVRLKVLGVFAINRSDKGAVIESEEELRQRETQLGLEAPEWPLPHTMEASEGSTEPEPDAAGDETASTPA